MHFFTILSAILGAALAARARPGPATGHNAVPDSAYNIAELHPESAPNQPRPRAAQSRPAPKAPESIEFQISSLEFWMWPEPLNYQNKIWLRAQAGTVRTECQVQSMERKSTLEGSCNNKSFKIRFTGLSKQGVYRKIHLEFHDKMLGGRYEQTMEFPAATNYKCVSPENEYLSAKVTAPSWSLLPLLRHS